MSVYNTLGMEDGKKKKLIAAFFAVMMFTSMIGWGLAFL